MSKGEAMHFNAPLLEVESPGSKTSQKFKVGIALIGGILIGSVIAISTYAPTLDNSMTAESTSLLGMPTSLRAAKSPSAVLPMTRSQVLNNLPGPAGLKELVLAGIEANNRCDRDVSMNANWAKSIMARMSPEDRALVMKAEATAEYSAKDVLKSGVSAPLGYWDPLAFGTSTKEGTLLFYREAELKHGRTCMLAFLGIVLGETFHPLFPEIDVPAAKLIAAPYLTEAPIGPFWGAAFAVLGLHELFLDIGAFFKNFDADGKPNARAPGDLGWDPLGLKPKDEKGFNEMQTKELNNGRLAMFATLGIIAQEMVTGQKTFR